MLACDQVYLSNPCRLRRGGFDAHDFINVQHQRRAFAMRLRCSQNALGTNLRHWSCLLSRTLQVTPHQHFSASAPQFLPNPRAKKVAVLGGGITGLATAFNLSRDLPNSQITIFESSSRLGGWLDSEKVEVDGGHVVFEWGPRTLRAQGPCQDTFRLVSMAISE